MGRTARPMRRARYGGNGVPALLLQRFGMRDQTPAFDLKGQARPGLHSRIAVERRLWACTVNYVHILVLEGTQYETMFLQSEFPDNVGSG